MRRSALNLAALLLLGALGIAAASIIGWVEPADAASKKVRKSQPASAAHAAPDTTATIAAPKVDPDQNEALPVPFNLPQAPRTRMRACGERWQNIKLTGQAGDQTWREYATKCLAQSESAKLPLR